MTPGVPLTRLAAPGGLAALGPWSCKHHETGVYKSPLSMGRKAVHGHTPSPLGASETHSPEFIPHQLHNLGQVSQATSPGLLFLIGTMGLSPKAYHLNC